MSRINRNKTPEEIPLLTMNGATIEGMKTILFSNNINKNGDFLNTATSSYYKIDETAFPQINELFRGA